ncbi:MAG: tRNA dimethylallyltransferase [Patescibacteria group bacterium]|jgi:tRNA dimethylallyltransferase|nr:tRNA dimethylallyltransferase [Patescibacteria group bacterium]
MVPIATDKLLVIVGQTASGKSSLAMELAEEFNGEIICADSRTIYREANIGTAKPSIQDQKRIKHHLLDVVNIDEPFSVADFKQLAVSSIADILSRGKLPILVGGSGLYIDAVLYNFEFRPNKDNSIRETFKDASVEELQEELLSRDIELPENSRNKRYLIRSLEAGSQLQKNRTIRDNTLIIGLDCEKEEIQQRSKLRADTMFHDGIVDEIRRLVTKYGWDSSVMSAPAYVAFRYVLEGDRTPQEAALDCVDKDLKLAKKQRTWFKRNKQINWIKSDQAQGVVQQFLQK